MPLCSRSSSCFAGLRPRPRYLSTGAGGELRPGLQRAGGHSEELAEASQEAERLRARAEADAQAIVRKAELSAQQAAEDRREVEEEIRAVKDEIKQLRADLERREAQAGRA